MPPKKGGKKGGKKKKEKKSKYPIIIDGVNTNEMTREEMESYIVTIRQELQREQVERNYFQLERDKIHTYWNATVKQLEDSKVELRNKDRELEDAEEKHQLELKIFRQKVKHIMYEHGNTESATKADKVQSLSEADNWNRQQQNNLRQQNMSLKLIMRRKQIESEESTKSLKTYYENELTKLREEFIERSKAFEQNFYEKMKRERDEMNLRRKTEIHEIEERKNFQIKSLIDNHDESFRAMKNFYNEITTNNISIIKTLKENIDSLRADLLRTERKLESTTIELKRKTELCAAYDLIVEELKRIKSLLENEKLAHKIARGHLNKLNAEIKEVNFENEVLLTRYNRMKEEREVMDIQCRKSLLDLQQKIGLKNLILERKVNQLNDLNESKDIQINQIIVASGTLNPEAVAHLTSHIEQVMTKKNQYIKDLEYELVRIEKSHNDLKSVFEKHLTDMNQYVNSTGMNVITSNLEKHHQLGKGPAGLTTIALL